jgi:hypothetical protein
MAKRGILEIGRFNGGSVFLMACANPAVPIYSIDIAPQDDARLREIFRTQGVGANVKLIVGDSQRERSPEVGSFDVLLVDGDHSYEWMHPRPRELVPGARARRSHPVARQLPRKRGAAGDHRFPWPAQGQSHRPSLHSCAALASPTRLDRALDERRGDIKADGESPVVSRVREAMDAKPRVRATGAPIAIDVAADGSLAIEGEVETVAALRRLAGPPAADRRS